MGPGAVGDPDLLAVRARAALAREIARSGVWDADGDPGARWRTAFEEVPRHLFVPYYFLGVPGGYERLWG
ncbi:methyltransferase, partial [Streptomyces albidoflavus]